MEHFRLDNTEGYTVEQLNKFNVFFEYWAQENGFDISDKHTVEYKHAHDKFFNEVVIYG
jgi:hypothetical protein